MNLKQRDAIHEDFFREEGLKQSSDRTFGLVFAALFLLLAVAPWLRGHSARPWAFVVGGAFLIVGLVAPRILQPLNRLWTKLGFFLQKVTNPIVMGLLFYFCVAPIGVLMRLLKHDALQSRWDNGADSYWIERMPAGHQLESMKDQF